MPHFSIVPGYQAVDVGLEFHDRYYHPEALTEMQREHMTRRHNSEGA